MTHATVFHIPVCPFSQRLEILLALKGARSAVDFQVVDITKPRAPWLTELSRGTTALPIMKLVDGRVLKESMVLLLYLDDALDGPPIAQRDPYLRAVENMMCRMELRLRARRGQRRAAARPHALIVRLRSAVAGSPLAAARQVRPRRHGRAAGPRYAGVKASDSPFMQ